MVTIRDIAEQAGVSVSTASRALNDNPRISAVTRRKIKSLADRLGYVPNFNAKSLTRGESNVVGVIFPPEKASEQANPFFIDAMRGINQVLTERKYVLSVAIGETTQTILDNVIAMVDQAKVKRFILLYSHENDPIANYLRTAGLRFVVIGEPDAQYQDDYVNNDNVAAGEMGTDYLLSQLNVKRPVFVGSEEDWQYERDRRAGFGKATTAHQVVGQYLPIPAVEQPTKDVRVWIHEHPQIDGIVASDDLLGLAFFQQWQLIYPGKKLPIVSYNRSFKLPLPDLQFHSITLFPAKLGAAATELVFKKADENGGRHTVVPFKML
ncbi:LacI family DNA-binding transcriptional regulator [Furfurilactobacillus siliginis]|uniref:Transcriptional regulator n=1 Tax=Furfurilactobacillus siliginis TaxID=348151 RepID=A0A0R2L105_9LACO|nr:LacI family DNA-binding transcriptional regulator [Furfurilactobacillus siliginis]KRN95487.1 transcriptional regulator [Furfurilactobacillus siliginis]GEK29437.1 LacI family transcriptional regulator [Furfurilactobacillus siliginis]